MLELGCIIAMLSVGFIMVSKKHLCCLNNAQFQLECEHTKNLGHFIRKYIILHSLIILRVYKHAIKEIFKFYLHNYNNNSEFKSGINSILSFFVMIYYV